MDHKLDMFRNDAEMHGKVVEHLIAKKVPLNVAYLFYQPETWEILTEKIVNHEYHFSELIEGYIDKLNGKPLNYEQASKRNFEDVRKIYMMKPMDRAVAHAIYLIYYKLYIGLSDDSCVSYKSRIGTSKVAKQLSGKMYQQGYFDGFKLDIRHYFDDVNMETIEASLKLMSDGSALDDLLWELYHDDRVLVNEELIHRHRGLIQGCAFACLLANLCLKDIDEEVSKLDVIYYRYSDDIICIGNETDKALAIIKEKLKQKGLMIHPEKFHEIHGDKEWFEFLGFKFKRDMISVSEKTLKNLEHEIKTRTISKTRELKRPATDKEIRKMIKDLQYYFYTAFAKSNENFGMGVYLFGTVNVMHDLKEIEFYCKDCLRAAATNKTFIYGLGSVNREYYTVTHSDGINVAENRRKTQSKNFDLLKECGWVSMLHMYKTYHTSKELYDSEVLRIINYR